MGRQRPVSFGQHRDRVGQQRGAGAAGGCLGLQVLADRT